MTENSFTGAYDLLPEPTTDSIFVINDLDDNFVRLRTSGESIYTFFQFALQGFSTAYTSTEPGLSSLVKSSWTLGDWEKLQRVNAPNDAYHVISGIVSVCR